jgi:hypothetical protein
MARTPVCATATGTTTLRICWASAEVRESWGDVRGITVRTPAFPAGLYWAGFTNATSCWAARWLRSEVTTWDCPPAGSSSAITIGPLHPVANELEGEIAEGDPVVLRITGHGTQQGGLFGVLPTSGQIALRHNRVRLPSLQPSSGAQRGNPLEEQAGHTSLRRIR